MECAGRAKRRRRFPGLLDWSQPGAENRNTLNRSKAVSRYACHRNPNRRLAERLVSFLLGQAGG